MNAISDSWLASVCKIVEQDTTPPSQVGKKNVQGMDAFYTEHVAIKGGDNLSESSSLRMNLRLYIQDVDVQCILQLTLIYAAGFALH